MFGFFRKRIDPKLLEVASGLGRNRFRESLDIGCSIYCTEIAAVDRTIRASADAQLMVLAILRPTLNFSLQDAYVQSGKLMNFEPLPASLTVDEERGALRRMVSDLPTAKANLDMRFRYMFANDLSSQAEDGLWNEMVTIAQPVIKRAFEQKTALNSFWVGVIDRLGDGDATGARQQLTDAR